jgi:hypothetical protein
MSKRPRGMAYRQKRPVSINPGVETPGFRGYARYFDTL